MREEREGVGCITAGAREEVWRSGHTKVGGMGFPVVGCGG